MLTAPARTPRVRFETVARQFDEILPRMDIAAFVGFAASGPLHVPVVVEDAAQYLAIFGDDAALATDTERGETMRANLGPAVRAFFANGGQRCWVVRVAGLGASHNHFPIPGLLRCGGSEEPRPAFARARAEGSWSDHHRLRAALRARSLPIAAFDAANMRVTVSRFAVPRSSLPAVGDLVRLRFGAAALPQFTLFARVAASPPADSVDANLIYQLGEAHWFADRPQTPLPPGGVLANVVKYGAADPAASAYFPDDPYSESAYQSRSVSYPGRLTHSDSAAFLLFLDRAAEVQVGEMLRVSVADERGWFVIRRTGASADNVLASPPRHGVSNLTVEGETYWHRDDGTPPFDPDSVRADIVSFDLRAEAGGSCTDVTDIGCTDANARFWGALPGDRCRYRPKPGVALRPIVAEARGTAFALASADGFRIGSADVSPPLSADIGGGVCYLPVGMLPELSDAVGALPQTQGALQRDGLERFDASLFLDPELGSTSTERLMPDADYLRLFAPRPRPLCGLHALLGFGDVPLADELTLVAVPDAVHRSWDCAPAPAMPDPATPTLALDALPDANGHFRLTWSDVAGAAYELNEASGADFIDARIVYAGRNTELDVHRPAGGTCCYRVRALSAGRSSAWSNALVIAIPAPAVCAVEPAEGYQPNAQRDVHRALLRLCAAQGQWFGILSLPRHFREQETRSYLASLAAAFPAEPAPPPLSYGAVYHPWVQTRDGTAIVAQPPDGAMTGVLASRAAARGAWVAPANVPLRNVVAAVPALSAELENAVPVNLIRDEPHGFLAQRADTLETADVDLCRIHVRRLLTLLRRLALRHGVTYAFEPNGEALQRLVQRRFEQLLQRMYDRGAFGGATPAQSFQVDTGPEVNTPASRDAGRIIAALRIRPAAAMEFITVRLLQTGDGLAVTEVH